MGLGETDLPRRTRMFDRGQRRRARAALEARDRDMVGPALGDAGRDRPDADLGDELHRHQAFRVDVLQVEDQLRQILDRVDVVVRRGRNETDARRRMTHPRDGGIDLMAGQLAAFPGLRALGHLDLHHVGVDEIFRRHAEATRRHLLDGGAHGIAVRHRLVAIRFLAAFARVRTTADAVHRDRERGMGLARDRTIGHGAGRKAPHDGGRLFDLLDRHRRTAVGFRVLDPEQSADGQELLVLLVQKLGEGAVLVLAVAAHRMLEQRHGLRRPGVALAPHPIGIVAPDVEGVAIDGSVAERQSMAVRGLLGDLLEAHALDHRGRAGEEAAHEVGREPNGIEDLGTAIGLIGRDAHLGHDLEQALVDRLDVALHRMGVVDLLGKLARQRRQRLEGQIRVDGFGAVARETGEVMDLARFAGLHDEADQRPQTLADQVVMHGRGREQRRDRDAVRSHHAIRQDDDVVAAAHRRLGPLRHPGDHALHALGAELHRISDVERLRVERVLEVADAADLLEVVVGQDRLADFEALALPVAFEVEDVGARPDEAHETHDELLADRVDRRVRHLGEVLLEIGVEQLPLVGQHRDRRVGTHGADRLLAGCRHGGQQDVEVFLGVAVGLLLIEQRHVGAGRARFHGLQLLEHDLRLIKPRPVGMAGGEFCLHLVVRDDAALFEVDQQHLAGLQSPFF